LEREFDIKIELMQLVQRLWRVLESGGMSGTQLAGMASKVLDPGALYTRTMGTTLLFWLDPEAARGGNTKLSNNGERTFDLLWLAYEHWFSRGASYYLQVLSELQLFYKQLRWVLIHKRSDPDFRSQLEMFLAKAAHAYISRVGQLADENFRAYEDEMRALLAEFDFLGEQKGGQKGDQEDASPDSPPDTPQPGNKKGGKRRGK
jgi:hypothetical protein